MRWAKLNLLKYFLILLFCFESVVPVFSQIPARHLVTQGLAGVKAENNSIDHFSLLFIVEPGTEEQAEKGIVDTRSTFHEIFSELIKFNPALVTWVLPVNKENSQPPLFTLHRVLLI
jgi:hypothetical protein